MTEGLSSAPYLACPGLAVAILERRRVGRAGGAVTEEIVPGFRFSLGGQVQSLLRPSVIRELEPGRHGLKLLKRNPFSFTPCLDGRYPLMGPDADLNHADISNFSKKDASAYPRYEKQLEKFAEFMGCLLDTTTLEVRHGELSLTARMKDKSEKSAFWLRRFGRLLT